MSKNNKNKNTAPANTEEVVNNNNDVVENTPEVVVIEGKLPKVNYFKNCTGSKQQISINSKNYTVLNGDMVCIPVEDTEEFNRVCEGAWFPVKYQVELPL